MLRRIRTSGGLDVTVSEAQADDHDELYVRFGEIVAAGEGYPQAPGPLSVEDFDEYWLAGKSLVAVARSEGAVVGSYYLKPNFPGRAAHIANGGYFVIREFRGRGVGTALVEESLIQARALGFDALQFNWSSPPTRPAGSTSAWASKPWAGSPRRSTGRTPSSTGGGSEPALGTCGCYS